MPSPDPEIRDALEEYRQIDEQAQQINARRCEALERIDRALKAAEIVIGDDPVHVVIGDKVYSITAGRHYLRVSEQSVVAMWPEGTT